MAISLRNPWGKGSASGGLDQQRSDLWVVDFSGAYGGVGKLLDNLKAFFPSQTQNINEDNLATTCSQISFPELSVAPETFYRVGRTPFPMPGSDNVVGGVRMVFRHSTGSSDIYQVLELWKEMARAGRPGYYNDGAKVQLPFSKLGVYSLPFRFDLPIKFYKGFDPSQVSFDTQGTTLQDVANIDTIFAASTMTIQPSVTYVLKNAWCGSVQLTELNQETGNQMLQIQAMIYPQYIFDTSKDLSQS